MDKDLNDSDLQTSQDGDNGQSLVGKLKKNVSEIISNTPLSKWFRKQNDATPTSSIRRRQDDSEDEEDLQEFQPPTKRTKLPPSKETLSLNVSEVLSPISSVNNVNKPLYRNFPEPIAGPSGYQTRKMLNSTSFVSEGNLRTTRADVHHENIFKNPKASEQSNKGNHSDSEESTSGYSSGRLGSKEMVSQEGSKQTSPLDNSPRKNRSLFQSSSSGRLFMPDRSLSPNRNSSLSSRMPSFNPSTFGSSSFVDRTLSTKRILNSPFYNGHTIYGGASAYGRGTRRATQDIHKVLRPSVKIKPVNRGIEKGGLQLGKTAKRILDTLEQYSSPVSDAKKIPVVSKKHKSEGSLTKFIGANPYTLRESRSASNRELQVPSVTDLLKMKMDQQKSRLQDSTEAVRQIATKSNSVLNAESYQIPVQRENEKHTTKIKTKISSTRQRLQHDEVVPEVKLNPVSLPIKELPKFDIIVPPPVQKPLTTSTASNIIITNTPVSTPMFSKSVGSKPIVVETKIQKENDKSISQNGSEFKFSAPLVLAEYLKPLKALNNFTFSEPLVKKRRSIHPELDDQENKLSDTNKIKKNNGENIAGGVKASSDNLMDKFKAKEGTWECSVCMIRNQGDKAKCVACENPKPKSSPKPTAFGPPIQLKPAENTWECPTCMIRNKQDLQKCAACEEKKPDKLSNKTAKVPTLSDAPQAPMNKSTSWFQEPKPSEASSTLNSGETSLFTFGAKFSAPSNTWECPTCMIRNKNELTNCAACETPNPAAKTQSSQPISTGTFGTDFKKKQDEWECQVCMVRNKANIEKCQCCESANPSYKPASSATPAASPPKVSAFNFGIDKNTASSFTFGIPPDSQGSLNPAKTNASLIFGEKREAPKASEPPKFSFGVPSKDSKETEPKKDPPKPSEKPADPPKTSSFSFGAEVKPSEATPSKAAPSVTFGTATTEAAPSWASKSQGASQTTTTTTPSFSFGTPKKAEETEKKPDAPAFSFGAAAKKSEETNQATKPPTFSFGSGNKTDIPKQVDTPTSGEAKINPLLKPSEKLPEKAAVAPVGFSFGLAKAPTPAAVSSTTSSVSNQQNSRPGESSPTKRSKPSGDDSTPQAKVPMFSFKAPATNGDVGASPFGKPTEESKPAAPVGGFSFNFAAKTPSATSANSASVAPTFGSVVSQADSSKQPAPMFKFASSTESPKQANGFSFGSSSPAFGAKTSTNTAEAKPFTFGSSAAPTQAPAASFGATPPKTSMFSFGSNPTGNKTTSTFSFNAPAENKTAPQYPTFGPPKTQASFGFSQSSAAPTFSFGSAQKTDSGFGVGSTTANPFGGAATTNTKPESVFGAAPTQTPALNGTFNFGASSTTTTTSQKAGFSFGAAPSGSSEGAAPPSGGFNFGASAPAAGGFNFSGAASTFDANTKPSFNFSGGAGVTTFSAPPVQDGAMPQRKIKKAIRRVR